jgi:prolipoprotein diacylglyceryltransferase
VVYTLFVALGVVASLAATRYVPRDAAVPPDVARAVRFAALVGGVAGAYLFELPADLCHWAAAPEAGGVHAGGTALLGRTVLGGLLGGWAAVELAKWRVGFVGATGDRFALPLALALVFGRLGCTLAGCCPGAPVAPESVWARASLVHRTPPRFPATLVEAYFHALAAVCVLLAARRGLGRGRRLAAYLAAYAVVRFALETMRANPRVALGLTYYQWLAVALFALAGGTLVRRSRAATA